MDARRNSSSRVILAYLPGEGGLFISILFILLFSWLSFLFFSCTEQGVIEQEVWLMSRMGARLEGPTSI